MLIIGISSIYDYVSVVIIDENNFDGIAEVLLLVSKLLLIRFTNLPCFPTLSGFK
jgi:hypothetical protein